MTVSNIHLQDFGVSPQVEPTALLHCINLLIALFVILSIWVLKFSLLSKVTPRNLTLSEGSIISPPTVIGRSDHFLFQVNRMVLVFSALILRPLLSHHFSMVLMVCCVLCQIISVSLPSANSPTHFRPKIGRPPK